MFGSCFRTPGWQSFLFQSVLFLFSFLGVGGVFCLVFRLFAGPHARRARSRGCYRTQGKIDLIFFILN